MSVLLRPVMQVRIERGVCLVRQYLPLEALANVDPVLEQNPRHPLALHVKVNILKALFTVTELLI